MSVAIVGSRSFNDYELFCKVMQDMIGLETVVSGGAIGADSLARKWANQHQVPILEIIPDWQKYGKYAGIRRNSEIVDCADWTVAFWDGNSPGTKSTIDYAHKHKQPVTVILY